MVVRQEREYHKLVVLTLAAITMVSVLGDILLIAINKEPPDALINLAFSCGGAIAGILTNTNAAKDKEDAAPKSAGTDAMEQLVAKSIIAEAMKQMGVREDE